MDVVRGGSKSSTTSQLGPLMCPFCLKGFLTNNSARTRKLRQCPYCKSQFFHYRGMYFVALKDVRRVRI